MKDYYKTLEIDSKSSKEQIIGAFRSLAKKWHPDMNKQQQAAQVFREIYEAYEILKDDQKRTAYDSLIEVERTKQRQAQQQWAPPQQPNSTQARPSYSYQAWEQEARSKADYYAKNDFKILFQQVLKKTANIASAVGSGILAGVGYIILYIISVIASFIELGLVIAVVIGLPFVSFAYSLIWGGVSIITIVAAAYLYIKIVKEHDKLWLFFLSGYNRKPFALFFIALLCYSAFTTAFVVNSNRNKKEAVIQKKEAEIADFKSNINVYTKEYAYKPVKKPYVTGKIIPISQSNEGVYEIDTTYYTLPTSLKPYKHSDVAAVVRISRNEEETGRYSNGGIATQISYNVELVNLNKSLIIYKHKFLGSRPPMSIQTYAHSGNGSTGSDPIDSVKNFLRNIPIK